MTINATTPVSTVKSVIIQSAGDSAGVVIKVNEFRLLAGDPLNTSTGAVSGRREVNWNAVPSNFTNANNFHLIFLEVLMLPCRMVASAD